MAHLTFLFPICFPLPLQVISWIAWSTSSCTDHQPKNLGYARKLSFESRAQKIVETNNLHRSRLASDRFEAGPHCLVLGLADTFPMVATINSYAKMNAAIGCFTTDDFQFLDCNAKCICHCTLNLVRIWSSKSTVDFKRFRHQRIIGPDVQRIRGT